MLKVKFYKKYTEGNDSYITIDSIPDYESKCYIDTRSATLTDKRALNALTSYTLTEIAKELSDFSFQINLEWWKSPIDVTFYLDDRFGDDTIVDFDLQIKPHIWLEDWSMKDFDEALKEAIKTTDIVFDGLDEANVQFGYNIYFYISDLHISAEKLISKYLEQIEKAVFEAVKICRLKNDKAIISLFDFPASVRVSCHQYLMYFAQFLKDLGIDADTEIQQKGSSTLFKVIPLNQAEALDQIKEALDAYVNAPALNDLQQHIYNDDIAYVQLRANIMHLKSQIMLTNSALQMKDATIQALQLSNYQLQNLLDSNKRESDNEEDIISGVVSLKKYDGKWFSVDLPAILNKLKRKFEK
jgi:hypothetical protein